MVHTWFENEYAGELLKIQIENIEAFKPENKRHLTLSYIYLIITHW